MRYLKTIPIIVLVGRSNVGKSTLFNLLTKTRDALVADFPGLTRDRKYGKTFFFGQEFIIVDTGGINNLSSANSTEYGAIETNMIFQSLLAIEEGNIIFFMVDMRSGLMPVDYAIAKYLRKYKKDIYLLVNKVDGLDIDIMLSDFYALGIRDIYPIAASHGRGIIQLIKKIVATYFPKSAINNAELLKKEINGSYLGYKKKKLLIKNNKINPPDQHSVPIKFAIVGRPNVGKSTLANCILGKKRVIVYSSPGTTRDSIYIPMERDGCKYTLIDTAGIRKNRKITQIIEKFSVIKTFQSIEDANVILFVIDAQQGISDQDLFLLNFILSIGRSMVIVFNKWDCIAQQDRQLAKNMLLSNLRLGFINFTKVHFISALCGSGGINNLLKSINEAYESSTRRISTALLTRVMNAAQLKHQPPLIRGRRIKMKYAHIGGYDPLIVVIHGNQVACLSDSYKRYLMNHFHRALQIIGAPIRIHFKESNNPYSK